MVGVTGRSKTCKTCKRRRIACSLERPVCNTCVKSSRVCEGYQDAPIFIIDKRSKASTPKHEAGSPTPSASFQESRTPPNNLTSPSSEVEKLERTISTKEAYKSLWHISSPHTRAVYRSQILSEFLTNYPQSPSEPRAGSWLALLPSHPTYTAALEASILAVCIAKLGRTHNDQALVKESLKFYIQGLWELQRALWDEKLMYREETVAACMCLIIYEVAECPDQSIKGWVGHLKGCARLFQLRGPKMYKSEMAHRLFLTFRQIEIQQAIAERRSTFLSQPAWQALPWKHHRKHISQYLLDLMAQAATLIESAYLTIGNPALQSRPDILLSSLLAIIDRGWKLDIMLRAFYRRFEKTTAGPLFWPMLSSSSIYMPFDVKRASNSESGWGKEKVFPVTFEFPNMGVAHTCMVYWATTCILWSGFKVLYSLLPIFQAQLLALSSSTFSAENTTSPPSLFDISNLPPLSETSDPTIPARNICQSIPYCMSSGPMAPAMAVFPLKVAIETLSADLPAVSAMGVGESGKRREEEVAWAEEAMEEIRSGRAGVRIIGHLGCKLTDKAFIPG